MDPPVIPNCPARLPTQYVSIPNGDSSGDFNVVWPVATDNDGQTPTVIATHQQGVNSFPLGRTLVTIYYYDTSGNRAQCNTAWVIVRKYLQRTGIACSLPINLDDSPFPRFFAQ